MLPVIMSFLREASESILFLLVSMERSTDLKASGSFYAYTMKQEYGIIFKTNTG